MARPQCCWCLLLNNLSYVKLRLTQAIMFIPWRIYEDGRSKETSTKYYCKWNLRHFSMKLSRYFTEKTSHDWFHSQSKVASMSRFLHTRSNCFRSIKYSTRSSYYTFEWEPRPSKFIHSTIYPLWININSNRSSKLFLSTSRFPLQWIPDFDEVCNWEL